MSNSWLNRPIALVGQYSIADMVEAVRPDRASLLFATRATASAMLAMGIAMALGFHEAFWGAVTAWVLAVPGRGMVFSKAIHRGLGTLVGAAAAFVIMPLAAHPTAYFIALSLFVGACAATATQLRRFQAYVAQLAGVTATLVATVALMMPEGPTMNMSLERVAIVLIGLATSTLLTFLFVVPVDKLNLKAQARQWASRITDVAAEHVGNAMQPDDIAPYRTLVGGLSEFEIACEDAAFESLAVRRRLGAIRRLTAAELSLLSHARAWRRVELGPERQSTQAALSERLQLIALAFAGGEDATPAIAEVRELAGTIPTDGPDLLSREMARERLVELADVLVRIERDLDFLAGEPSAIGTPEKVVHRHWARSIETGLRAALAMLIIGLLWHHFHWPGGAYAYVLASVACAIFGTMPSPILPLRRFAFGIVASLPPFVLWHALPDAVTSSYPATIAAVMALTFVGAMALSKRFAPAIDFNINIAGLMLGSGFALRGVSAALTTSLGMLVGLVIGYMAFALLPGSAAKRERRLKRAVRRAVAELAAGKWRPLPHKWETRMYDLLSQSMQRLPVQEHSSQALATCLAALDAGLDILRLRTILLSGQAPEPLVALIERALRVIALAEPAIALHSLATEALALAESSEDVTVRRLATESAGAIESIARCRLA